VKDGKQNFSGHPRAATRTNKICSGPWWFHSRCSRCMRCPAPHKPLRRRPIFATSLATMLVTGSPAPARTRRPDHPLARIPPPRTNFWHRQTRAANSRACRRCAWKKVYAKRRERMPGGWLRAAVWSISYPVSPPCSKELPKSALSPALRTTRRESIVPGRISLTLPALRARMTLSCAPHRIAGTCSIMASMWRASPPSGAMDGYTWCRISRTRFRPIPRSKAEG